MIRNSNLNVVMEVQKAWRDRFPYSPYSDQVQADVATGWYEVTFTGTMTEKTLKEFEEFLESRMRPKTDAERIAELKRRVAELELKPKK